MTSETFTHPEYEVRYSAVRERRGMDGYCLMRLSMVDGEGIEVWIGVSTHRTEADAEAARVKLTGQPSTANLASTLEQITFAKAGGPPANWRSLKVFDGATELKYVHEVDTVQGYALVHYTDEAGRQIIQGQHLALRRINSPNLSIRTAAAVAARPSAQKA
jgi:hypothetical protein